MNYLIFIVHPAKYHLLKPSIDKLLANGHRCDIVIISKDVLPELLEKSGLPYTNIFPGDRRSHSSVRMFKVLRTLYSAWKTTWRLWRYIRHQKIRYDLFVTDDCLAFLGKLLHVPVLFIMDTDFDVAPENAPLLSCATAVFAPQASRMGRFTPKKIGFCGYKENCYLAPNYFTPDPAVPERYGLEPRKYVFIRLVAMFATHDFHKIGISDKQLDQVIALVQKHGLHPLLCMERDASERYREFCFSGNPADALQMLAHAALYFGDSQTMNSEAVLLGVPAICCNDFYGRIGVTEEQEKVYDVTYTFPPSGYDRALQKIDELLAMPDLAEQWQRKRRKMLEKMEDASQLLWDVIRDPAQLKEHCSSRTQQ